MKEHGIVIGRNKHTVLAAFEAVSSISWSSHPRLFDMRS